MAVKKGRGFKKERDRIELRQSKVYEMRLKGLKIREIASALNVTGRTIKKDMVAIDDKLVEAVNRDIEKFNSKLHWKERADEVRLMIRELWPALIESKSDRSNIPKAIIELWTWYEKCMRNAGIKMTDVKPEDLITDTIRIIHENAPDTP